MILTVTIATGLIYNVCRYTHTHTHTHARTHTHSHTNTHTPPRACTHTHTGSGDLRDHSNSTFVQREEGGSTYKIYNFPYLKSEEGEGGGAKLVKIERTYYLNGPFLAIFPIKSYWKKWGSRDLKNSGLKWPHPDLILHGNNTRLFYHIFVRWTSIMGRIKGCCHRVGGWWWWWWGRNIGSEDYPDPTTNWREGRKESLFYAQPIELARFFQWKIIDLSITYAYFVNFREFFHREGPCNETGYIVCVISFMAVIITVKR